MRSSSLRVRATTSRHETGVTAVYDRHGYDVEKRHALDTWAARLEEIISGKPASSNVVALATAGETQ